MFHNDAQCFIKLHQLPICNQPVAGSSPISSSNIIKGLGYHDLSLFYFQSNNSFLVPVVVPVSFLAS